MTTIEKYNFIYSVFPDKIRKADHQTKPVWGKMNMIQMVEHMSMSVRNANGKLPQKLVTPPDKVQAMYDFVMSEKEFRPETKNVLLSEDPYPVKNSSMENALEEYRAEVADMKKYFEDNRGARLVNPFFGELDFDGQCQLLFKHEIHHLKQFGIDPSS